MLTHTYLSTSVGWRVFKKGTKACALIGLHILTIIETITSSSPLLDEDLLFTMIMTITLHVSCI